MQNLKEKMAETIEKNKRLLEHKQEIMRDTLKGLGKEIEGYIARESTEEAFSCLPNSIETLKYQWHELKILTEENEKLKKILQDQE